MLAPPSHFNMQPSDPSDSIFTQQIAQWKEQFKSARASKYKVGRLNPPVCRVGGGGDGRVFSGRGLGAVVQRH